jgi:hypothetical protein
VGAPGGRFTYGDANNRRDLKRAAVLRTDARNRTRGTRGHFQSFETIQFVIRGPINAIAKKNRNVVDMPTGCRYLDTYKV